MNILDIIILILLIVGGLNGLRQGFVKAFTNLIGWILALLVAAKYANFLAPSMVVLSHDAVVQKIAAFAFIVLLMIVLTWIVTAILDLLLKSISLGPLNRLLGGAFGTLKGLLLVLVTMQGLSPWVESASSWKHSKFVQVLMPYAPLAAELSKEAAQEALQHVSSEGSVNSRSSAQMNDTDNASDPSNHLTKNPFY